MRNTAVATKVKQVGDVVGPKAREIKEAIGPRVKEIGGAVGPKVKEIGEAVGPKVQELRQAAAPKVKAARRKVGFWIAGEEPKSRKWPALAAAGVGAAVAFFLDPVSGKRRRAAVGARAVGIGAGIASRIGGARNGSELTDGGVSPASDAALTQKVQSEVFQDLDVPSGQININVEKGLVVLRGTLDKPSQIIEVEKRVWEVGGVRGVENLLHLEGTPTPTH